ncbi:glycosyltransferase family 2 protein [Synechocystis sp. PCC 7509]|uniref:glycosyltransferase family 2 protein n=1 Tax=Synechocystis sp. PCC 7509 TaxID=927677 RepID=UPI0002ACE4F4|nr:glycosyltransferase family 2 protein [Synechocystis sp. PCC 7509]
MSTINPALTLDDLPAPPPRKSGWPWTEQSRPPLVSKMPPISIITPSYNQGEFIEATIRSVLLQGYSNLDYIVIDGGSTDNSVEIIKKYQPYLSYWVSEKDGGQSDAINKGINKSTGEIIGWINSDDVYTKNSFSKVINGFSRNSDCILVHGDRILIDRDDNVTGWGFLPAFDPTKAGFNVCSETAFWRRSAMEQVGLLDKDLKFAVDLEFFCRLYKVGKFIKLNEYLGYFRCHADSKSSTIAHIGKQEAEREWQKLFGSDNTNWKVSPQSNFFIHRLSIFKHPILIGYPYLVHKFKNKL